MSSQKVLYSWKYIDFDFVTEKERDEYIQKGQYQKNASVPIDTMITSNNLKILRKEKILFEMIK